MDLIKKLTGKDPIEYEVVAKSLVDNSDVELFSKLVKQDDFLFDFIKNNVANRIRNACTKENYLNLLKFFDYYSVSYADMMTEVLYSFGKKDLMPTMKEFLLNGNEQNKAYATKYFNFVPKEYIQDILVDIRLNAKSDYEPLCSNSIELLSSFQDEISKNEAINKLKSDDEFEQYDAVKFLVTYQATDCLEKIIDVMKKSSLAENIASEIPYLVSLTDLIQRNSEDGVLVLCNIINAIPEIISPSAIIDYDILQVFETIINSEITSSTAVMLILAKDKFAELISNDEYLFDCDKNTKNEINEINNILKQLNSNTLESLLYDELYEESDFVFFALDFVNEPAELETLLDSKNQTLILKVLSIMKEKGFLNQQYKDLALNNVTNKDIRSVIEVL